MEVLVYEAFLGVLHLEPRQPYLGYKKKGYEGLVEGNSLLGSRPGRKIKLSLWYAELEVGIFLE